MYYLSKEELKKACESNRFIVLRAGFDKVAINCRVAFLKHPQRKYAENIDGKTKFNGFYPCDFNEYITLKIPYFTQST